MRDPGRGEILWAPGTHKEVQIAITGDLTVEPNHVPAPVIAWGNCSANSGHRQGWDEWVKATLSCLLKIGPLNEREAQENGLWLKA